MQYKLLMRHDSIHHICARGFDISTAWTVREGQEVFTYKDMLDTDKGLSYEGRA